MLVVILLLVTTLAYCFGINRILGLPPGPPPLPLIGNMLSFRWDLDKVLLDWKSRYGRVFTVWLPNPMIVLGDHQLLQEHVVKNGSVYLAKKNPEQLMDMWFGGLIGLTFQDTSMVKDTRKFALKSMHEIGIGSLEDVVHNHALEVVTRWRKSSGEAVDVTENIAKAVGNVIWRVIFGNDLEFGNEIIPRFRKIHQNFIPLIGGPLMMAVEMFPVLRKLDFLFGNHFARTHAALAANNAMVEQAIKITEKSFDAYNQPNSFVEAFLREMKSNEEAGKPTGNYHSQQLIASASNLWGAGFDTTVGILRMCILELINHPDVQRKLQEEIDQVIRERRIRNEDQMKLPYTCAFLQEVYRLANVLPINFLRQTTQATEIEGRSIAAGTTVLPQFSMVHMDPKEYERPDFFCPERHIDSNGNFIKDARIAPFSVGSRACLGEGLARMEVFILFATFVQHCHFAPVSKIPPPVTFEYGFGRSVTYFTVNVKPRC